MDTDASSSGGWRFAQCFGDKGEVEDITEGMLLLNILAPFRLVSVPSADIISTVEFDSTGNYLATGDKGGRVVLFERNEMVGQIMSRHPESTDILALEKGLRVQVLYRVPIT